MQQYGKTARDIAEQMLERTGQAMLTGDAALFESCVGFPSVFQTFDGQVCCETPQHFALIFRSVERYLRQMCVTDMVRNCIEAQFTDPETISMTYECRMLSGHVVTQPAYPVFTILRWQDGGWKITFSSYAITDAPEHSKAIVTEDRPSALALEA